MARRSAASPVAPPPQVMRVWAALGAIYLIWGSTYLAIRLMVETVPPALGAGARFVLAGGAMLAVLAVRGGRLRSIRLPSRGLPACAGVGAPLPPGGHRGVPGARGALPA